MAKNFNVRRRIVNYNDNINDGSERLKQILAGRHFIDVETIAGMDSRTKRLWMPGPHDVVCRDHFTQDDYRETLLGGYSFTNCI